MNDWERRRILEEALREAVQPREATPAEERVKRRGTRKRRPALVATGLILGWLLIAWIWLARPDILFGPATPPPPSAEVQEASLRFGMYLERRRIEMFMDARGRLPVSLAEAGPVEDGVEYQRTGRGYVLTGRRGDFTLRLTDAMDAEAFLGRSVEVLER